MSDNFVTWLRQQLDEDEAYARAAATFDRDTSGFHWQWACSRCDAVIDVDPVLDEFLECQTCGSGSVSLRSVEIGAPSTYGRGLPAFVVPYAEEQPTTPAAYIVRWEPARVLVEVEAKRRIIDLHAHFLGRMAVDELADMTLRLLALPYANRPGYREEWAPR